MKTQTESILEIIGDKTQYALERINIGSPILVFKTMEGYLISKRNAHTENLIKIFGDESVLYTATGANADYFEIFSVVKHIFDDLFYQFSPNFQETYDVHVDFIAEILHKYMRKIMESGIWSWQQQRITPYAVDVLLAENNFFDNPLIYTVHYNEKDINEGLVVQKLDVDLYGLPLSFLEKVEKDYSYSVMSEREAIDFLKKIRREGIFDGSKQHKLETISVTPHKFTRIEI